jgi:DNA-binding NarL/FixJ family response regulator
LLLLAGQALFRTSLGRFLASEQTLEVVAECGSSGEALEALRASSVDVVLLDCDDAETRDDFMPAAGRNGYQGHFLAITGTTDLGNAALAIKLGAAGIFLKSDAPERLVQAITLVANGAVWLDQRILRLLAGQSFERFVPAGHRPSGDLLADREQKVLLGILGGLTNRKIGENLGLSEGTIKTSVQQLFLRAGVRRRSQLVRAALEGSLGPAGRGMQNPPAERLAV